MEKAGEILKRFFEERGISLPGKNFSIFDKWSELVGRSIGKHSRVIELDRGSVIVEVDHPGFSQLIYLKKNAILEKLNREYPDLNIKNIRVVLKRG